MELYKEILTHTLSRETAQVTFPGVSLDLTKLVESTCYRALVEIRSILRDETLTDAECFRQIEQVICALELIDSNAGHRHDF